MIKHQLWDRRHYFKIMKYNKRIITIFQGMLENNEKFCLSNK